MIEFVESKSPYYQVRTEDNVIQTDGTLAFAVNTKSAGEKLTHKLCIEHHKPYLLIDVKNYPPKLTEVIKNWMVDNLISRLNVAGNGLGTIKKVNSKITQQICDQLVYLVLKDCQSYIQRIQSGGQSGFDEAAIKAAVRLNIPCKIIAPKGWRFRDAFDVDHSNEEAFKERFE